MLGWLWRGLKLRGIVPVSLEGLALSDYDKLDEVYPLPIGWNHVYITCAAFPVCRDIWQNNEDSVLHELLPQARAGVLLVADSTVIQSAECLHLIYEDTDNIDPFEFDAVTPPQLVHPGWKLSCEKLIRH